jgi:polyphenol oxidase
MVPYLQSMNLSNIPGVQHGFFTRKGGVSQGVFSELNIREKGDRPEYIQENRRRIAAALGFEVSNMVTSRQIHSPSIMVVDRPFNGRLPEVDGLITTTPGLLIGIMTADCVPILFAASSGNIVAAVHAGWRGAISGIIEKTIQKMKDLGAHDIIAALGPCIWQENYEVSQEFYDNLAHEPTFFKSGARPNHWQFDLPAYVMNKLKGAGVQNISPSLADTYADSERFFSCRRATHLGEPTFGDSFSGIGIL